MVVAGSHESPRWVRLAAVVAAAKQPAVFPVVLVAAEALFLDQGAQETSLVAQVTTGVTPVEATPLAAVVVPVLPEQTDRVAPAETAEQVSQTHTQGRLLLVLPVAVVPQIRLLAPEAAVSAATVPPQQTTVVTVQQILDQVAAVLGISVSVAATAVTGVAALSLFVLHAL